MELVLLAVVAFGALLFIIGYFAFVVAGFKHHFVTGVIAALPVLNIITVPVLWYRTGKKIILSIIGIILIVGAWFLGADKGIEQLTNLINNQELTQLTQKPTQKNKDVSAPTNQVTLNLPNSKKSNPSSNILNQSSPYSSLQRELNESEIEALPEKPIYMMVFENIPVNKLSGLVDQLVRITTHTNDVFEGEVKSSNNTLVTVKTSQSIKIEVPIVNIKELKLMVKKVN